MNASIFITDIREEFAQRVKQKTGWGSVEIRRILEEAMVAALAKHLPELSAEEMAHYRSEKK